MLRSVPLCVRVRVCLRRMLVNHKSLSVISTICSCSCIFVALTHNHKPTWWFGPLSQFLFVFEIRSCILLYLIHTQFSNSCWRCCCCCFSSSFYRARFSEYRRENVKKKNGIWTFARTDKDTYIHVAWIESFISIARRKSNVLQYMVLMHTCSVYNNRDRFDFHSIFVYVLHTE